MIREVALISATGRQAVWDGTNPDEIREVAGERFRGLYEAMAMVENEDGDCLYLSPGWSVTLLETGRITIGSPGGAETLFRETA